ncbi:hypothetical protein HZY62_08205 [Maribacter polysiphoniae]|uniref:Uncharacterized protein n=1 Tax=Maribacter polysiphoniae TaxID=429344 RepID=A0A316E2I4_9FLAO|nr:hypothetical protein [Maribacter polysiphoniae]MBD1260569.1 hypothetical protein [Maribacter polysiphoniae]PWK24305.1 hypothetical protein LX92_01895 [Maribacter polysiphoniae]
MNVIELQEELIQLLDNNYASEHILSEYKDKASSSYFKDYLQECSIFFRELGDHLYLALAVEGIKMDFRTVHGGQSERPWIDNISLRQTLTDHEILEVVLEGHSKAVSDMEAVLENKVLPYDLAMVIEKGLMVLKGLIGHVHSLADLSK